MLKPVNDVSLVTGVWNKQRVFAPGVKSSSSPTNDKGNVRIVLSHLSTSWFEVRFLLSVRHPSIQPLFKSTSGIMN